MSFAPPKDRSASIRRVAVLIAAGAVVIFGAKYVLGQPSTFEGNGVSFQYPRTWEKVSGSFAPPAGITLLWTQGFALDDDNGAGVAAANIGTAVPEGLLATAAGSSLEPQIREVVAAAGGTLSGPQSTEIAGREALIYEATNLAFGFTVADVSLAVVADGAIVYFIVCQKTAEKADEIDAGCDTIIQSFTIGSS